MFFSLEKVRNLIHTLPRVAIEQKTYLQIKMLHTIDNYANQGEAKKTILGKVSHVRLG